MLRFGLLAKYSVFSACLVSASLFAAQLKVADNLEVKELNGKSIAQGFFKHNRDLQLSSGKQALVVRYKDVFEDEDLGQDRVIESDYFVILFNVTMQKELRLKTAKVNSIEQAERFSYAPEVVLHDGKNNALQLSLENYKDYQLTREVNKVIVNLPDEVTQLAEKSSQTQVIQSSNELADDVANDNVSSEATQISSLPSNEQVLSKVDSLPMLKYWWQKASAQDKQAFLQFIKTN